MIRQIWNFSKGSNYVSLACNVLADKLGGEMGVSHLLQTLSFLYVAGNVSGWPHVWWNWLQFLGMKCNIVNSILLGACLFA